MNYGIYPMRGRGGYGPGIPGMPSWRPWGPWYPWGAGRSRYGFILPERRARPRPWIRPPALEPPPAEETQRYYGFIPPWEGRFPLS